MSDDAKTASGSENPKKPADEAMGKTAKKGASESEKAPTSQAVPPVVRRRAKAESGSPEGDSAETPRDAAGAPTDANPRKDAASKEAPAPAAAKGEGVRAGSTANAPGAGVSSEGVSAETKAAEKAETAAKKAPAEGPAAALARKAAEARAAAEKAGIDLPPAAAPVRPNAEGSVAVTDEALDAEIRASGGGRSRTPRKRRAVSNPESETRAPQNDEGGADPRGEAGARSRRSGRGPRSGQGPRDGRGPREGRGPQGAREGRGPRDGRGPRGRNEGRGPSRPEAAPVAAVGQTTGRRIYRQDVSPQVAAARAEEAAKAAEVERKRKLKESQDKVTLILHPAPKAALAGHKKKGKPLTAKEALQAKTSAQGKGKAARAEEADTKAAVAIRPAWKSVNGDGAVDALNEAGASAEALVKAWLEANNVAALAAAAQSDHQSRKSAKRALNVLRSRGVDVPKPETATPLAREEAQEVVALFISPDSTGATFFSISQRQPGGRYHVVDIVVRRGVGVVHANSAKLAGKHIKGWQNRVEKQYGTKPVQVSTDWARYLISEGRKLNDVSKQLVPLGYDSCAALITPVPAEEPAHPLAALIDKAPSKLELEKAVADSDKLHGEPEFGGWMPDRPALDELLAKVGERVGPDGVKDSAKVDEAIRLEVAAATDRWFTPERRSMLADNMRDCAISIQARQGDEPAKRVAAVAQAIRDAGLITAPPSEIPFLLHYFQKAVAYLVRQNRGQLRVPIPAQP